MKISNVSNNPAPQPSPSPKAPSAAAKAAQEATETAAQTAKEAAGGDAQAKRLLAKEDVQRAQAASPKADEDGKGGNVDVDA